MADSVTSTKGGVTRPLILAGVVLVLILIAFYAGRSLLDRAERGPDPETIVSTSLQAMQAQNRLVPFTARFVSVTTSRQRRFGGLLEARRTLILPGTARYELDMAALEEDDLDYSEADRTLTVTLPELEIAGPEVDLEAAREYGESGILGAVTDADEILTDANQRAALTDLRRQARGAVPMSAARDAARDAVRRNFELPLAAAGLTDVNVRVRFVGDPEPSAERVDASTSYEDAIEEARRRRESTGN